MLVTASSLIATTHQSDLDLVQRHRYGDLEAFDEIYRRYHETIYNLSYRMSGDLELAADLTQEVFLRVFRYLDRFRGGSSLKTWVYRVALNHCRSRLGRRRLPTQPLEDEEGHQTEPADGRRSPEQRAMDREQRRTVNRALALLPPVFREAVVLCDLQGMSYQEIAEVLGVRIGTVRSRIARGRERLRELLEEKP